MADTTTESHVLRQFEKTWDKNSSLPSMKTYGTIEKSGDGSKSLNFIVIFKI